MDRLYELLRNTPGRVGLYARNLVTGEQLCYHEEECFMAASVIKLPVLVECFAQMAEGRLQRDRRFRIREQDKLPSCGALSYMHEGLEVTLEDLYTLMIILSDNTATNILIDTVGIDSINRRMRQLGLEKTTVNRRLFMAELSRQGIENYIVPGEIGRLLELLERGEVVSPEASRQMLRILRDQRLNGKIPVLLPPGTAVAHKTGEDDGISHDVGIVYGPQPFVLCLCGNEVDRGRFERSIQTAARWIYDHWSGEPRGAAGEGDEHEISP